ncbi:MAG: cell division protein FtsZ [Bacteroidales bacterium]|nr:cell division protein FtsZ [Bacteroidales bacterium]
MLKFERPKNQSSIIKVLGVGGGGSNAVNHMHRQGITGVDFIVCNTDAQALDISPVPNKIQLGEKGLGAGSVPMIAEKAAIEKSEEIKKLLSANTEMLFITAGMGGGTGTGAAPVIAKIAKEVELGDDEVNQILVVAIVTLPFKFEGRKREQQAIRGIAELRKYADAVLIISNDKLREQYGNLGILEGFKIADNVLLTAAKGIAEIITVKAYINIDFKDVNTVMKDSGVAIMGTGIASGENRAQQAIEDAISSPLLNDNDISGAQNILLYLSSDEHDISFDEITEITEYITDKTGPNVDVIWGAGKDDSLGDKISVTIVATGFDKENKPECEPVRYDLYNRNRPKEIIRPSADSEIERGIPRPTRPAPEPVLDEEENEELPEVDEIKFISKPDVSGEELIPEDKELEEEELAESSLSESGATEEKTKIIRFTLDDVVPEPEKQENISRISAPVDEMEVPETNDFTVREDNPETKKISKPEPETLNPEDNEVMERKAKERVERLRQMSIKLKSPGGLSELETEPAYRRKNVELSEEKPSEDSQISKYTLGDDEEGSGLKDNSFLHDNVD